MDNPKMPDCLGEITTHRPANMRIILGCRDYGVKTLGVLMCSWERGKLKMRETSTAVSIMPVCLTSW